MSKPKSPLDDEFDDALLADEEEEIRQQNSGECFLDLMRYRQFDVWFICCGCPVVFEI